MLHKKETAWKKNRQLGDIYGGRKWRKFEDRIFSRFHTLKAPGLNEKTPILMVDNPSRDFFHPLKIDEVVTALNALPNRDTQDITHIWLPRIKKKDYLAGDELLAAFICGSGVRLIVLNPWPIDRRLPIGKRPTKKILAYYAPYTQSLIEEEGEVYLVFTDTALRRFYIEYLLYHEIGHHVDWYYRHWSPANVRAIEDAADQYAFAHGAIAKHVINHIEKKYQHTSLA